MIANGYSLLTLAGSTIYLTVAAICVLAFIYAFKRDRPMAERCAWLFAGGCFIVLALMRILGIEEILRDLLRQTLLANGTYTMRRTIQGPIAATAILTLFAILFGASGAWRPSRSRLDNAVRWGRLGLTTMAMLVALRLISFHPVDALLYKGPHLNWLIDIGSSLVVAMAGWQYTRLLGIMVKTR